jgi:SAM-dependent methyltransferase
LNHLDQKDGLHLGCGSQILDDMVNLDIVAGDGVDLAFDLDAVASTPLPFEENRFSRFLMHHTLEHLHRPLDVMQELYRVAKPGAVFQIAIPHGFHEDAWVDPTHTRPYFPKTFQYFGQPKYYGMDYGYTGDWDLTRCELRIERRIVQGKTKNEVMTMVRTCNSIVKELYVELTAINPARPRERSLLKPPAETLVII